MAVEIYMTLILFWSNFNVLLDRIAAVEPLNINVKNLESNYIPLDEMSNWKYWMSQRHKNNCKMAKMGIFPKKSLTGQEGFGWSRSQKV